MSQLSNLVELNCFHYLRCQQICFWHINQLGQPIHRSKQVCGRPRTSRAQNKCVFIEQAWSCGKIVSCWFDDDFFAWWWIQKEVATIGGNRVMNQKSTPPSSSRKRSRGLQILQEMGVAAPSAKAKTLPPDQISPTGATEDAEPKSLSDRAKVLPIEHSHLLKVLGMQKWGLASGTDKQECYCLCRHRFDRGWFWLFIVHASMCYIISDHRLLFLCREFAASLQNSTQRANAVFCRCQTGSLKDEC